MRPTPINTLAEAMLILSRQIESEDGVANAAIAEAGFRLRQIAADLCVVLPLLGSAALFASRRTKDGRIFRAAHDRLAAEVLA